MDEIAELFALHVDPHSACEEVKQKTTQKIKQVREKIHTLQQIERTLVDLVTACEQRQPTGECPILETLIAREI